MAIKKINVGYLANDGTGDDLREAFIKVNDNFEEMQYLLENAISTEAENLGTGTGIFREKLGNVLKFKSLIQGNNILLNEYGDSITITANSGLDSLLVLTDAGSQILNGGDGILYFTGGQNLGSVISIEDGHTYIRHNVIGTDLVFLDKNPALGGNLLGNNKEITDLYKVTSVNFIGNLQGNVHGIDIRDINAAVNNLDFGQFNYLINSTLDYIVLSIDIDFGSFTNPHPAIYDPGAFV